MATLVRMNRSDPYASWKDSLRLSFSLKRAGVGLGSVKSVQNRFSDVETVDRQSDVFRQMSSDSLEDYVRLRKSLVEEKRRIEERLQRLNKALEQKTPPIQKRLKQTLPFHPKNKLTLREAVRLVTSGKKLSRDEILKALERRGYRFCTSDPGKMIDEILDSRKRSKSKAKSPTRSGKKKR